MSNESESKFINYLKRRMMMLEKRPEEKAEKEHHFLSFKLKNLIKIHKQRVKKWQ